MYSLTFLGIASFLLAVLLTPPVRNWFRRHGILDRPDLLRKLHPEPIPRVGGIVIAIAYVLAYALLLLSFLQAGTIVRGGLSIAWRVAPAALLIFATGLLDDLRGLKPWQKLFGQIAGALTACWAGVYIAGIGGHILPTWLAIPITVVWLLACTNAFNLIDGVDGLAAGVGLFATVTMLLAALLQNNVPLALATVPLAGALLGFLRYNFNPATIFLGDSGSLLIGFLLGCYGVLWSEKSATILGMTAPLMALAIPLLDTSLAIARRFLRQQPIFTADRGHIHHRLLDKGLTPRKAVLILYGAAGIFAILSLCTVWAPNVGLVLILFCACTWIGIQHLGYLEFGMAGRMFMEGAFRRLLNSHISLQAFEQRLSAAATPDHCFAVLKDAYREFGFCQIDAEFAGRAYRDCAELPLQSWAMRVPLGAASYVELRRPFGATQQTNVVASFIDVLRKILTPKLAAFDTPRRPADSAPAPAPVETYQTAEAGD